MDELVGKYVAPAMHKMVSRQEGIVRGVLDTVLGHAWLPQDVKNRCRWVRRIGQTFETLTIDGEPVLELHDIEMAPPVREDDRYVQRVQQKYRLLGRAADSASGEPGE